jgi:hypothetical protein
VRSESQFTGRESDNIETRSSLDVATARLSDVVKPRQRSQIDGPPTERRRISIVGVAEQRGSTARSQPVAFEDEPGRDLPIQLLRIRNEELGRKDAVVRVLRSEKGQLEAREEVQKTRLTFHELAEP